jgi:hypothetical protein
LPKVVKVINLGHKIADAMKKVKITVMRMASYSDLMEQYENPILHACDMQLGQTFIV